MVLSDTSVDLTEAESAPNLHLSCWVLIDTKLGRDWDIEVVGGWDVGGWVVGGWVWDWEVTSAFSNESEDVNRNFHLNIW